jgi:uncharacterized membrane protein
MNSTILTITTFFSGLMAGLFYAWSISVTPGLAKINNESYIRAFQSMNRAILNPAFFIAFFGLVILLLFVSYTSYQSANSAQFWLIISATSLYIIGIMFVTIAGNIPLNNSLEVLNIDTMTAQQMETFRSGFEAKWNSLNMIRTICSSASFILLIIACLQK